MPVQYRPMLPAEEDAAIDLWVQVLETSSDEALQTFRDFRDDPRRFARTRVAVAEDGTLLSTICYWLRDVRDGAGAPTRIGHLYHIATRPAARNQGHAGNLLTDIVHDLSALGCAWAVLSARQSAVPLYARHGWRAVPRQYWRGTVDAAHRRPKQRYRVQPYDPRQTRDGWSVLADLYAAYNATRAGSLIRDDDYWQGYARWMFGLYLDAYQATLFTAVDATPDAAARGYALVTFSGAGFDVSELAVAPGDPIAFGSLLDAVIAEATRRQLPLQGQLTLPSEPNTAAELHQLFGTTLHRVDDRALYGYDPFMMRPIGGEANELAAANLFGATGALFWPLDAY